jgi:hypothetical protein
LLRRRQGDPCSRFWQQRQKLVQPAVALPCGGEAFPMADGKFDRRQGAAHDDGGGNHYAARGLLMNDQKSADGQYAGLKHHSQRLGERGKAARHIARTSLGREVARIDRIPAMGNAMSKSHRLQSLCITPGRLCQSTAAGCMSAGLAGGLLCQMFGKERQTEEKQSAHCGRYANPKVEDEANAEIQRHPGQIKESDRPGA